MNYSRKELTETEITMNQMRNSLYNLVRFMEKNGIKDLKEKIRRMGQNIARTYIRYWKPSDVVTITNLKDIITTIYQKVLNSTISIEMNDLEKHVIVQDYKCALCKYHYDDLEIAGCEILLGMVSEFVSLISKESTDSSSIILEPLEVRESRTNGNKSCIQIYKYKRGSVV
jgi:ribosomal protein L25 (general stress protein Ctc)